MRKFEGESINDIYLDIINEIHRNGNLIVKEDGCLIKEIYPATITVNNPQKNVLLIKNRPYNPAFLAAETLWNLNGETDDWLISYNLEYKKYFTDNRLLSSYGNRIFYWNNSIDQLELVIDKLKLRPYNQHATISIFNPQYDLNIYPEPKFIPCITLIKFKIRDNKLFMNTFMRAQDIWLGFPYDIHLLLSIFQFAANILGLELGQYNHICDVIRLYEKDFELSKKISLCNSELEKEFNIGLPNNYKSAKKQISEVSSIIKEIGISDSRIINDQFYMNLKSFLNGQSDYMSNLVRSCYAYRLVHLKEYDHAIEEINSITCILKEQFSIWAEYYHPKFFKYMKANG